MKVKKVRRHAGIGSLSAEVGDQTFILILTACFKETAASITDPV